MTGAAATSFPFLAAAASSDKNSLIVSVHDVAPPTRAASEKIINELERRGVGVCSVLVVPDYHHSGPVWDNHEFMGWLRKLEGAGHEIVIHGYFHERPAKEGETLHERLLTRCYTAGEGEFYDLDYAEALRRITRARDEFAAAGLKPRGFIAPAWLLGREATRAAANAEMEYTTRLTTIIDLRRREAFHARSLVYSVRTAWRRAASLGWNGALSWLQASHPLIRLGIHPPDLTHSAIWAQIIRSIETFAEFRTPTTYRDWLAERRATATGEDRR